MKQLEFSESALLELELSDNERYLGEVIRKEGALFEDTKVDPRTEVGEHAQFRLL
jgi:hypothetical protein